MPAAEPMVPKRLKIKFGNQRIKDINIGESGCDKSITTSSVSKVSKIDKSRSPDGKKYVVQSSDIKKRSAVDISKEQFSVQGMNKHGSQELTEDQPNKRQKLDRSATQQCSRILQMLMRHRFGWVFNQPVDPVKLNIPDYFSVVSKPMDLGTVKSNLDKSNYLRMEAFADDVRLTFSNAMLYNPPSTDVHHIAKELLGIFEYKWKSSREKWNGQDSGLQKIDETRERSPRMSQFGRSSVLKNPNTGEKAASISEASVVVSSQVEGLHKAAKNPAAKSYKDITSDNSDEDHPRGVEASKQHCQASNLPVPQRSKSDSHSDGTVTSLDDANVCYISQPMAPLADTASVEGLTTPMFDLQMSPEKSLRAVMLKSRFADTILRAKQKTLLDQRNRADQLKMEEEKAKLERRHRQERARIEAEIRDAVAASKIELKRQRESEREAARIALQRIKKTVEFEDNLEVLKELELLCERSLSYPMRGRKDGSSRHPLELLGLFLKD